MFEESPDGFIARWRDHAASVRIFSRTEGLPLLECEVGGAILQTLERTGPYLSPPGPAQAIVNPTAERVELLAQGQRLLEASGLGRVRVCGTVIRREDPFLVVDAGAPLVVGVHDEIPPELAAGSWVSFEALPPIHAFVLREPRVVDVRRADGELP